MHFPREFGNTKRNWLLLPKEIYSDFTMSARQPVKTISMKFKNNNIGYRWVLPGKPESVTFSTFHRVSIEGKVSSWPCEAADSRILRPKPIEPSWKPPSVYGFRALWFKFCTWKSIRTFRWESCTWMSVTFITTHKDEYVTRKPD